jgi:hypothetical protein
MKVGDMVRMVTGQPNHLSNPHNVGLVVNIDRRHGVDCNRHSRVATIMTNSSKLVTWPLDSHYEIRVINENR